MKKRILGLFSGVAIAALLAACSSGTTAQTETLAARNAAYNTESATKTSVQLDDAAVAVREVSLAKADTLRGLPEGTSKESPRHAKSYTDADGNLYQFDAQGRLTAYVAPASQKASIRLQKVTSANEVVASLPEKLESIVPHVDRFTIWEDPNERNNPNSCILERALGKNQVDTMEVIWDGSGAITSVSVTYASDTDVPLPDSVKDALLKKAQAAMEARKAEMKAPKAEMNYIQFDEQQKQAEGLFTFVFTDESGCQWAEDYTCTQALE